jgi:hypothetical protein
VNYWVVKTLTEERTYVPYDSIGMNSFILYGLRIGKVTVNGSEVINHLDTWKFK